MNEEQTDIPDNEGTSKEVPEETPAIPGTETTEEAPIVDATSSQETLHDEKEKDKALPTPEEILNKINAEIMAKEDETPPEAKPTKKPKVETDGGSKDNTLLIIGIAAVLIAVGLFLWLNYQKKVKALNEGEVKNDDQKLPYDEREYYNN